MDFYADSPWVTAVGGTSASVVPSGTAPTGASYASVDDPASRLNKAGWKRGFEVGWQTGTDQIQPTATDRLTPPGQ